MIELKFEQAVELLNRAVDEKGADFTYDTHPFTSCVYYESDGTPSCIVGHVFSYLGITKDDLTDPSHNQEGLGLMYNSYLEVDYQTLELLEKVQSLQDNEVSWGQAVDEAIDHVTHFVA